MNFANPVVVHLVSAGLPGDRIDVLRTLLAAPGVVARQLVLHVGPGQAHQFNGAPAVRVYAPALPGLRAYALRRTLQTRGLLDSGGPLVVHAWTLEAAKWCLPLAATNRPLLLEAPTHAELGRVAAWSSSTCLGVVCPTAAVRRLLGDLGVPTARCTLIYPAADPTTGPAAQRAAIRARLGLDDHHLVITTLPPVTRQTGTFIATWAALLLEKVRPNVRLVIPADGREADRVWRLVTACRHEAVARRARHDLPLSDLLAASDLAAYLPTGSAPLNAVALAMATSCPLVATNTPSVAEVLDDGQNAWLCKPGDPADAARAMLRALEDPGQSHRQAQNARARAETLFVPAHRLHQYRLAYANLAARRPAGAND